MRFDISLVCFYGAICCRTIIHHDLALNDCHPYGFLIFSRFWWNDGFAPVPHNYNHNICTKLSGGQAQDSNRRENTQKTKVAPMANDSKTHIPLIISTSVRPSVCCAHIVSHTHTHTLIVKQITLSFEQSLFGFSMLCIHNFSATSPSANRTANWSNGSLWFCYCDWPIGFCSFVCLFFFLVSS